MTLPEFDEKTGLLPPGEYQVSWDEFVGRFVTTPKREELLEYLKAIILELQWGGCKALYVDGSFITIKPDPSDLDVCWDTQGVDKKKIDKVFFDTNPPRKRQKDKYRADIFMSGEIVRTYPILTALRFFQWGGKKSPPKGIVLLELEGVKL